MVVVQTLRIYVLASLIMGLGFAIELFPEGFGIAFFAFAYALCYASPSALLLLLLFGVLGELRLPLLWKWIILLICIAPISYLPYHLLVATSSTGIPMDMKFLLPLVFVSGYTAVLLRLQAVHQLLQNPAT